MERPGRLRRAVLLAALAAVVTAGGMAAVGSGAAGTGADGAPNASSASAPAPAPGAATADAASAGTTAAAAASDATTNASVDAIAVWERDDRVRYSLFGHAPPVPRPVGNVTGWTWWSPGGGTNGTVAPGRSPDVAFSRTGTAVAVWTTPDHGSVRYATFEGDGWSEPAVVSTPPGGSQVYDPSVAFDGNGTGLVVWTRVASGSSIRAAAWNGTGWRSVGPVATGPSLKVTPEVAFTAAGTGREGAPTRARAVVAWWDEATTRTVTCDGSEREVQVYWPHSAAWNGTFTAPRELPGRPDASRAGYSRSKFPREARLGLSPDQHGTLAAVWTPEFDPDPCDPTSTPDFEVWNGTWNGTAWEPDGVSRLREGGPGAAVAYRPDGDRRVLDGSTRDRPSVAALHVNHNRTVSAWRRPGDSTGLNAPIVGSTFDYAAGAERGETRIGTGRLPAVAAHTGSPGTPLAERNVLPYIAAADGLPAAEGPADLTRAMRRSRRELRAVGSTSLVNAVVFYDVGPGDARVFYVTEGREVDRRAPGEVDTGDPDTLRDHLAWSLERYPADRHMLVASGHGFGWRGTCHDTGTGDSLNATELAAALNVTRGVDTVVFESCEMADVETAYELRDRASYMVAAPVKTKTPGYRYDDVLSYVTGTPHDPSRATARRIVELSADWTDLEYNPAIGVWEPPRDSGEPEGIGAVVAIDLAAVPALVEAVDGLARTSIAESNFSDDEAALLRLALHREDTRTRDVYRFSERIDDTSLRGSESWSSIRAEARAVLATREEVFVARQGTSAGLNVYAVDSRNVLARADRGGLDAYNRTAFARATAWEDFLWKAAASTETAIELRSPAPSLVFSLRDADGNRVGLCRVGCRDGYCPAVDVEIPGATYSFDGDGSEVLLPSAVSRVDLTVTASGRTPPATPWNLSIATVEDGEVRFETAIGGTIGPNATRRRVAAADLTPTTLSAEPAPTPGRPTTLVARIENVGALPATNASVAFLVNGTELATRSADVGPGAAASVAVEWTPASTGPAAVDVVVDPRNRTAETTRSNNTLSRTVAVADRLPAVCPGGAPPTDPDGDGTVEDLTGDGTFDVFDVQCMLDNFDSAAVQDNPAAYDLTGDGRVTVFDVQALLDEL